MDLITSLLSLLRLNQNQKTNWTYIPYKLNKKQLWFSKKIIICYLPLMQKET